MPDVDSGSLNRLRDIADPSPVPWWPPAPGWFVVLGIARTTLAVFAWLGFAFWRRNRYRREATRELDLILCGPPTVVLLNRIAELLNRVALAAYPRDRVAALTGDAWLAFLDETGKATRFAGGVGRVLKELLTASARRSILAWLSMSRTSRGNGSRITDVDSRVSLVALGFAAPPSRVVVHTAPP